MTKKVLLTGAAGFIGSNLTKRLLEKNFEVSVLIKKDTNPWRLSDVLKNLNIYTTSLANFEDLGKLFKKIRPEYIIHLAAFGNTHTEVDPIKMVNINLIYTANLLLAADYIDYKCFINTGSSSEYGFKKKPMLETDILSPNSFYAATKASSSAFCTMHAKSRIKPIVTVRPFSVYGPFEEPGRLIPQVINNMIDSKPVNLTKTKARRDFIYIDDLTDGYLQLMEKINKNIYGEVFNLGTGHQYTNEEIVEKINQVMNKRPNIHYSSQIRRAWDTPYWVANIGKAKMLLKWKPKHTLIQGLKKTVTWFTNYDQRIKKYT